MDFVIPGATVKNIMTKGHSQNTKTSSNGILKTLKNNQIHFLELQNRDNEIESQCLV